MATRKTTAKKTTTKQRRQVKAETPRSEPQKATRANTAATRAKGKGKATTGAKTSQEGTRAQRGDNKASAEAKKRGGILDAAAQVLAKAKEPMGCKDIVEQAIAGGLWSTSGKTPQATLYSAILREIQKKGKQARFEKTERGRFRVRKGA